MTRRRWWPLLLFAVTACSVAGLLTFSLWSGGRRTVFLPGTTTPGHYQIEQRCDLCHTPFGGVKNDACLKCHGAELTAANDSHPLAKFQDPRNADRLARLDAAHCVTCHREHRPHLTRPMGVTQPDDYCFNCHSDIAQDRPSHANLPFNTCATAGCHNYHDNSALYQDFIVKHAKEPPTRSPAVRPARILVPSASNAAPPPAPVMPAGITADPKVIQDWAASAHAQAGVNCTDCHQNGSPTAPWVAKPTHESCARCHDTETQGFLASRHGMRLAAGLGPMTPALARLPMHAEAAAKTMDCNACHGAHRYDTAVAAVASCLTCHNDAHSRAYESSPHAALWRAELRGAGAPGSGVSCATCHLPREIHRVEGSDVVRVQHNQNANLRPNEKMLRTVCLDCHGYGFALDALADPALIRANFRGPPAHHVDTIRMALERSAPRVSAPSDMSLNK